MQEVLDADEPLNQWILAKQQSGRLFILAIAREILTLQPDCGDSPRYELA
jgi:hypothetical protein